MTTHDDALIAFQWGVLTDQILPAIRALVLTEDPRPLLALVSSALRRLPPRGGVQQERRGSSKLVSRAWFSLYALAPLCEKGGTEDMSTFVAHLVAPNGKRDPWGEEYATRSSQLFRAFRADLSRRLATATWPGALEGHPSPAADDQLDELFAELILFFASPRYAGEGDFSQDPEGGALSATLMEIDNQRWHVPLSGSRDGFAAVRDLCPALFTGARRPPFSRDMRGADSETLGPLLPAEVPAFAREIEGRADLSPALRRVVKDAAERGLGLFTWKCGL
jgi:hypothetical protein